MSVDRDVSRDRSMSPKHKHSFSDFGKLIVPMWDSSDPDRAPPPLPLNPQNPNTSPTRANTSENVAAAARALVERANQNSGPSHYTTNPMQDRSREKSPTRTPQHKRLQSLQHGNLKDIKPSFESSRGWDRCNSRPSTPTTTKDSAPSSPERNLSRSSSPTAFDNKESSSDSANGRRASSIGPRPILGENTPPSATMLAIQNMPNRENDTPLGNIMNSSNLRSPQTADSIFSQMKNLTNIATILQKEMAALSRRSKDNATDLVSLKEATKTRDEDIRRSLRELVANARASDLGSIGPPRGDLSRSASAMDFVPKFLETIPYHSPTFTKSASLPRNPPAHAAENAANFSRANSPAPYLVESPANIAMLEKIIRDMGTKEGQDRLLSSLSEFTEKSTKDNSAVVKKVEELVNFIREKQTSKALVKHHNARGEKGVSQAQDHQDGSQLEPRSLVCPQTVDFVSDELRQVLQKIKDSVAQGGGLTGEVKSLVRELRGEVLGMGRELGRKLEKTIPQNERALGPAEDRAKKDEIGRIVQDGLAELKVHMDQLIQTKRRQSSGSAQSRRSAGSSEVYALVKQSFAEQSLERTNFLTAQQQYFDQEAIITAVKEAYEAYKPDIELQQFGLERDEILQCLKEGLEDYQSTRTTQNGISRDEIIEAVQEAMHQFIPPAPVTEAFEIKEEILVAVRECLESFQPPPQVKSEGRPSDVSREDILGAVREGLGNFRKEGAREIEINRDDLFLAVKAGLDNTQTPFGGYGEEVLRSLHDIVEGMRVEFKEYSAANGRDTELVLDTTKDGLESLRVAIQSYVDRSRDVTGNEEITGTFKNGLEDLRKTVNDFISQASSENVSSRSEVVDYFRIQLEQVHQAIATQHCGNDSARTHEEVIRTLNVGLANLKSTASNSTEAEIDDVLDAMKEEFERLREAVVNISASHRDELLEAIRENVTSLSHNAGIGGIGCDGKSLISTLREEFGNMRDTFAAPVLHTGQHERDSNNALAAVQDSIEGLRVQLSSEHSETSDESLGLIKEEFGRIREVLSNSLVSYSSSGEKTDLLEAIRDGLEALRDSGGRSGGDSVNTEAFDMIREEFDVIRQSISSSMVQGGTSADVEGIVAAIRTGFDDLQTRVGTSLGPVGKSSIESEGLLSALHDSLMELRADVSMMADKPVVADMTVSYDILDTLKDGISDLRADIEHVKAVGSTMAKSDIMISDGSQTNEALSKADFEKLEIMLTRLQTKVEAMDLNTHANQATQNSPLVDSASREAFTGIETMIYELRGTVDVLVARKAPTVSKEDTDALETLLQNTKAKIDEDIIPSLDATVTKDQLDAVEAVVRLTGESIEALSARFEADWASKDDVAAVYQLLQDTDSSIKAFKDHFDIENSEKPSKDDLDAIENICDEIKDKVDNLPTSSVVPTNEDLKQLTMLIDQFKESYDQFRGQYESDLEITAKAFDDRKDESEKIIEQISELKSYVTESKEEIKSRLKRGNEDVRALDEILQEIEDKIDEAPNAISDVQEVLEIVNREFERCHTTMESMRTGQEAKSATMLEMHEGLRAFMADDLGKKLDDRLLEVLARQDDQQQAAEHAAQLATGQAAKQDDLLTESRIVAEDLRLTIDTLGESITAISPALRDTTEKMADDAKTVFNKVEDLTARVDANHVDAMGETQLARQEVSQSLLTIVELKDIIVDFQPQAIATLSNLLALVREHYEHSKRYLNIPQDQVDKSSIEETIRTTFASLPLPRIEDAPTNSVPFDDSRLHSKLDELLLWGKYDDTAVQGKLDDLVSHSIISEQAFSDPGKIDGIHKQLEITAAELSAFLARQTESVAQEHENVKREAIEAAEVLARCHSNKEDLERKVENLTATRASLALDVESLMADRDNLTSQKSRLAAEVSSLETALSIRREELQEMDSRADSLERRIIEGVMNQSRALLIAKQPKQPEDMSLKRVTSNVSNVTASTTTPSSIANAGMNIALSRKRSNKKSFATSDPAGRRNLSLGQITGNVPYGISVSASRPALGGLSNLKRSQSVKNPAIRKPSWAVGQNSVVEFDKENDSLLEDSDEDLENEELEIRAAPSITDRSVSQSDRQTSVSGRRTSSETGPSEYSYATGSYMTGSDSGRTTSYGSTVCSVVGGGSLLEDSTQDDDEDEGQVGQIDALAIDETDEIGDTLGDLDYTLPNQATKDLILRRPDGYDSGLGSDLPTALAMSNQGSDYFASSNKEQDI